MGSLRGLRHKDRRGCFLSFNRHLCDEQCSDFDDCRRKTPRKTPEEWAERNRKITLHRRFTEKMEEKFLEHKKRKRLGK